MIARTELSSAYILPAQKGYVMTDKTDKQEQIEWITTNHAAKLRPDLTRHTIAEYCRRGTIHAEKRGRDWWVNKASLMVYEASTNAGRPRKEEQGDDT